MTSKNGIQIISRMLLTKKKARKILLNVTEAREVCQNSAKRRCIYSNIVFYIKYHDVYHLDFEYLIL